MFQSFFQQNRHHKQKNQYKNRFADSINFNTEKGTAEAMPFESAKSSIYLFAMAALISAVSCGTILFRSPTIP